MPPADIKSIAERLSEVQRDRVMAFSDDYQRLGLPKHAGNAKTVGQSLLDAGVALRDWDGDAYRYRLTPLGQQVRQYLENHNDD